MEPSASAFPDERAILQAAKVQAERLLRSLQSDADSLPIGSEGHRLHLAAIDAAGRTLNNLTRLIDEGRLIESADAHPHGRGSDPT